MSLPVPLRWPSLLPSITASIGAGMEGWKEGDILNTPSQPLLKVVERGKICRGAGLCFMCFSAEGKKNTRGCRPSAESAHAHWCGNREAFNSPAKAIHLHIHSSVWWLSIRMSNPVLMALMKMCHSHVFHAGYGEPPSAREETRRRHRPMLCCAVSDWWVSVVALWLGLRWFITTAHNVIRLLCVYTLGQPVLRYDRHICVFLRGSACRLPSCYHNAVIGILLVAKSG